jgi:hypothetical protein
MDNRKIFFPGLGCLVVLVLVSSCSKQSPVPEDPAITLPPGPEIAPMAIIKSGENPLWFEVGPGSPVLLNDPGEASISPFEPWPFKFLITGMVVTGDRLVMAVNRGGFLALLPGAGAGSSPAIALYHVNAEHYWDDYTAAAPFLFRDRAAALLYRHDRFIEPTAAIPSPRFWGLELNSLRLVPLEIPALEVFPAGEGWDVDTLLAGRDDYWYYRGMQKSGGSPAPIYFRSSDLAGTGERSSPGVFRNATASYTIADAPTLLQIVLNEAFGLSGGMVMQEALVSTPAFPAARRFVAGTGDVLIELAVYYRDGSADTGEPAAGPCALAVLPDGRGVYARMDAPGTEPRMDHFSLPPLPEGFVYTRIGLLGDILIGAWEEQFNWNVGAAGFMIINAPR